MTVYNESNHSLSQQSQFFFELFHLFLASLVFHQQKGSLFFDILHTTIQLLVKLIHYFSDYLLFLHNFLENLFRWRLRPHYDLLCDDQSGDLDTSLHHFLYNFFLVDPYLFDNLLLDFLSDFPLYSFLYRNLDCPYTLLPILVLQT